MMLFVPIHPDALWLKTDQPVLDAKADFTRLPYTDGTRDFSGDAANLSEEILRGDFQSGELYLKAGIHLHWALPDALTKGFQTADGLEFPAAPNRWLVTRTYREDDQQFVKRWIVESDYLYPAGTGDKSGSISFPLVPPPPNGCPFRFLGRKMPLEAWQTPDTDAEYLKKLTAVGYGDPTFAAFYPNCRSVFGFHDPELTALPDGLRYEIAGWYADARQDCLNRVTGDSNDPPQLLKSLERQLKWTVSLEDGQAFPDRALFYADIVFSAAADAAPNTFADGDKPQVTVANTGTEALSAYLAYVLAAEAKENGGDFSPALKSQIEDQLEALSLASFLSDRQLDIGAKFLEARHTKDFSAVAGGTLWSIAQRNADESAADARQTEQQRSLSLPAEIAHHLNLVNVRQKAFDKVTEEIESGRRQLFADWYKYMICAYPPDNDQNSYPNIDEVRDFIETEGIARLRLLTAAHGALRMRTDAAGNVTGADAENPDSQAGQLAEALNELFALVNQFNTSEPVRKANAVYNLQPQAAPRYYQPNEPVVLLTGEAVALSFRHGQDGRLRADGLLECDVLAAAEIEKLIAENPAAISAKIAEIKTQRAGGIAFGTWTRQPWNAFLLEWEAQVFPLEHKGNTDPETRSYAPDFIKSAYALEENHVDFSVAGGRGKVTKAANIYSGSSILTAYAENQMIPQIENYLIQNFYAACGIPREQRSDDYFARNKDTVLGWYRDHCPPGKTAASANIYRAYLKLTDDSFHSLSQSLGGFNEALLMRRQSMQMDIADPLGFDDYRKFTDEVRETVSQSNTCAPLPLNDFNPIRAGALKLRRLRLIDTFGRILELDCDHAITTEQLNVPGSDYRMTLPPRITQPARLNFRWLAAESDEPEMNDHPKTSPICGWLLPNHLDGSLMIYDARGKALGAIDRRNRWQPAPGSAQAIAVRSIENPHLRKVVAHILDAENEFLKDEPDKQKFLSAFLAALDTALENIEPENFAQYQDIALLMGSPVAVVRAAVELEVRGAPAIHQGWNVFRQDLRRAGRATDGFDEVEFPIRLGEFRQFNDGIVGYWKEAGDDFADHVFYAPQSGDTGSEFIKTHETDALTIYQTIRGAAQTLTVLMDPRGSVHATTGVLPVKAIDIPAAYFADALKAIEITFPAAPVLTDTGKLNLPLPDEPGFRWSWLQKTKTSWTEITSPGIIAKSVFVELFAAEAEEIWKNLEAAGWIKPLPGAGSAEIAPVDKRSKTILEGAAAALTAPLESLLDQAQIGIADAKSAAFGNQKILEGWLKLSQTPP